MAEHTFRFLQVMGALIFAAGLATFLTCLVLVVREKGRRRR